jgi:hypothetical protein
MSAHRATTVRVRPRRQPKCPPVHRLSELLLRRHGIAIAPDVAPARRVPTLAWPANLFSDVHPMAVDDWMDDGLSVREGPDAGWDGQPRSMAGVG